MRSASLEDASSLAEGSRALSSVSLTRTSDGALLAGTGATMERAFSGCASLTEVRIEGALPGEGATAREMLAGAGAGGTCSLSAFACGGSADVRDMMAGSGFSEVAVTGSVTGDGADATGAMSGMASVERVTVRDSFTGAGTSCERLLAGAGSGDQAPTLSVAIERSCTGGGSQASMLEGAFSGEALEGASLAVAACGDGASSRPSSAASWLKGATRLSRADLTGMPAAAADVTSMLEGVSGMSSLKCGGAAAAGEMSLPGTWDMSAVTDASRMCAGAGFESVELAGLGSASSLNATELFQGCTELERVTLTGAATGGITQMQRMFQGCSSLAHVDMTGVSTAGMGGSQATVGATSPMSDMFQGSALATDAAAGAKVPTEGARAQITLSTQMAKLLNGFFGQRAVQGGEASWALRECVDVHVNGGPATASALMPCPQGLGAKIYLDDAAAVTRQMDVWATQGYAGNLGYDNMSVRRAISGQDAQPITGEAWGTNVVGYGFVGDRAQEADGSSVAWVMRRNDAGTTTLTILPVSHATSGKDWSTVTEATQMARLRPYAEAGDAMPWTGIASGGAGMGYSGLATQARVYSGVATGSSAAYLFQGCTQMTSCDLTSMTTTSNTTNYDSMFQDCTALTGAYFNALSKPQHNAADNETTPATPITRQTSGTDATGTPVAIGNGVQIRTNANPGVSNAAYQWETSGSSISINQMFHRCYGMKQLIMLNCFNGSSDVSGGIDLSYVAGNAEEDAGTGCEEAYIENVGNGKNAYLAFMLAKQQRMQHLEIRSVGNGVGANLSQMVSNCYQIPELTAMDTTATLVGVGNASVEERAQATQMQYFFNECNLLHTVDMRSVGTGQHVQMVYFFSYARGLTYLDADGVGTGKHANLSYFFSNAGSQGDFLQKDSGGKINARWYLKNFGNNYGLCEHFVYNAFAQGSTPQLDQPGNSATITWTSDNGPRKGDQHKGGYTAVESGCIDGDYYIFENCAATKVDLRGMPRFSFASPSYAVTSTGYKHTFGFVKRVKDLIQSETDVEGSKFILPMDIDQRSSCSYSRSEFETAVFTSGRPTDWAHTFEYCEKLTSVKVENIGNGEWYGGWHNFRLCTSLVSCEIGPSNSMYWGRSDHSFSGDNNVKYIDYRGVHYRPSAGSTGNGQYVYFFDGGAAHFAPYGHDGGPIDDPGTILLGEFYTGNGLLWFQRGAGLYNTSSAIAPEYVMASNVKVVFDPGPVVANQLAPRLDMYANGVHYQYQGDTTLQTSGPDAGKPYLMVPDEYKDDVWKEEGYFGGKPRQFSGDIGYGTKGAPNADATSTVKYAITKPDGSLATSNTDDNLTLNIYATTNDALMRNWSADSLPPWSGMNTIKHVKVGAYSGYTQPVNIHTSMSYAFANLGQVDDIDLSNLRATKAMTNTSFAFSGSAMKGSVKVNGTAVKLPAANLMDFSGVTNLESMFNSCSGIEEIELSNVANVKDAYTFANYAFAGCTKLKTLTLDNVITSNTGTAWYMAYRNPSLTSLNLKNVLTGAPESLYAFAGNEALKSLTLENLFNKASWNNFLFAGCTGLNDLKIKNCFNDTRDQHAMSVFSDSGMNDGTGSLTIENSFNSANGASRLAFQNARFANVTITDSFNGDGARLGMLFWSAQLQNVTLNNVANGKAAELWWMFRNVSSGVASNTKLTFDFTDVGKNSSNMRNAFYEAFRSNNISPESSLTWNYTDRTLTAYNVEGAYTHKLGRGSSVSMGSLFSQDCYTPGIYAAAISQAYGNGFRDKYDFSYGVYDSSVGAGYQPQYAVVGSKMPKYDLRGLPNIADDASVDAMMGNDHSVARMFSDLDAITSVGYATSDSLVLSEDWDISSGVGDSSVNNAPTFFRACDALESVTLVNFIQSNAWRMDDTFYACNSLKEFTYQSTDEQVASPQLNGLLATCPALEKATFSSVDGHKLAPRSMEMMFLNCASLKYVDLRGLSSAALPHTTWSTAGGGNEGMNGLFTGCTAMMDDADHAKIIVGPDFKHLRNGFFSYREMPGAAESYVIQADVDVYGGPQLETELMQRPSTYVGIINLLDEASVGVSSIWELRDYINLVQNGESAPDLPYGNIVAKGDIGHVGSYDFGGGDAGASEKNDVKWSLRTDPATNKTTLVIYPNDYSITKRGVMQEFSMTNEALYAPWGGYTAYADTFDSVVVLGDIQVYGSLEGMFVGCTALKGIDLSQFDGLERAKNVDQMFAGATAAPKVTNHWTAASAPVYEGATQEELRELTYDKDTAPLMTSEGIFLPAILQPERAVSMLQDCTGLESVDLVGFATGAAVNLNYLLAGAGADGSEFQLTNVAASAPAASLQHMMEGANASKISCSVVGQGAGANASYLLASCGALEEVTLDKVASVGAANLTSLASGCTALKRAYISDTATGASAVLTGAFEGCTILEDVTMTNVGSGQNANLTSMFAGCSTFATRAATQSESEVRYATEEDLAIMTARPVSSSDGASGDAAPASEGQKDPSTAALRASAQDDTDEAVPVAHADAIVTYALTDVGTGAGARLTNLLSGAFTSVMDEGSSFTMARSEGTPVVRAGDLAGAFDAGEGSASYMPSYDLSGLSHAPAGAPSMELMFRNLKAVKWAAEATYTAPTAYHVPGMPVSGTPTQAEPDVSIEPGRGLVLPAGWDVTTVTSFNGMFQGCSGLETVYLQGLNRGARPTMDSMFEDCSSLAYVGLAAPLGSDGNPDYGLVSSVLSMKRMFAGCSALTRVNLRGIGTSYLTVEGDMTSGTTGMEGMFEGCDALISDDGDGRIVIGRSASKVGNGFFGQTAGSGEGFTYVISASVYVFGGPTASADLMMRPGANETGQEDDPVSYKGTVYLMDADALKMRTPVWVADRYLNTANSSGISEAIRDAGFIGLGSADDPVTVDGVEYNGQSVEWVLRGEAADIAEGHGLLAIRPADGAERALMRAFDATGAAAPWRAGTDLSTMFDRVVVEDGIVDGRTVRVEAAGDLAAMFYGLDRVTLVDLTHLVVSDARTRVTSDMFNGCASVTSVTADAQTAADGQGEGVLLPLGMDTSAVTDASGMFANMTALASCDLTPLSTGWESTPFMGAAGADLSGMFEGSFADGAVLKLKSFGNGEGADMTRLAAAAEDGRGGGLAAVEMTSSAQGARAKMTAAFRGNSGLQLVGFRDSAKGEGVDLTYMLEGCGTDLTSGGISVPAGVTVLPASATVGSNPNPETVTSLPEGEVVWTFWEAATGGAADLSHMMEGALTSPVADASRIALFSGGGAAVASVEGMLGSADAHLHMPTIDLRGITGITGSAESWMEGVSGPASASRAASRNATAASGAVTLRHDLTLASTTSLARAFARMADLESFELAGISAGAATKTIDLTGMLADCPKLATATLAPLADGKLSASEAASASDMTGMFQGDAALASVDMTGVITGKVFGNVDAEGTSPTGMRHLFEGCERLAAAPGAAPADPATDPIRIGEGFTKVLNGFFWDREDTMTGPAYILAADVAVTGGPRSAADLMVRPEFAADGVTSTYAGTVFLDDDAARSARGTWLERRYLNVSLDGENAIDPGNEDGPLIDWGLIGYVGAHQTPTGQAVAGDGGSVAWSVHDAAGERTLYIFPTDGTWGRMRAFGTGALAPWTREAGSDLAATVTRVEVSPGVAAGESLSGMFEHMSAAKLIDLRNLQIGPAVTSMQGMFEGCAAVRSVSQPGDADEAAGIALPPSAPEVTGAAGLTARYLDTTGVASAMRMLADMPALESVELSGAFGRNGASLLQMLQGSLTKAGSTVSLSDVGNGRGADMRQMMEGAEGLAAVTLSGVGNGDAARLSRMMADAASLLTADIADTGNGAGADLSGFMAGTASATPGGRVAFTLTDVGCGGTEADAGADMTGAFEGAFTCELDASSLLTFRQAATEKGATAASLSRFLFAGDGASSHLPAADLRGLPAVTGAAGTDASLSWMLSGMDEIQMVTNKVKAEDEVPGGIEGKVLLPYLWDTTRVTTMDHLAAGMAALAVFDTTDLVRSRTGTSLAYALADCPNLRRAIFDAGASELALFDDPGVEGGLIGDGKRIMVEERAIEVTPGRADDMRYLFANDAALDYVDFYGLGTVGIGEAAEGDANATGQAGMFSGCSSMVKDPSDPSQNPSADGYNSESGVWTTSEQRGVGHADGDDHVTHSARPEIVLGAAFTTCVNGFFWDKPSASAPPAYILLANLDVYGGPQAESGLMTRPSIQGQSPLWSYNAWVNLADEDAFMARSVWAKREYMNMKMLGEVTNDVAAGTELLAGGYVGLEGRYGGATYDGTSVKWEVLKLEAGEVILRLSPDAGQSGVMRAFGSDFDAAAPWAAIGAHGELADLIDRVEVSGQITCSGNLSNLFRGLVNATSMDLRGLSIVSADPAHENPNPQIGVVSMAEMLRGCASIERVVTVAADAEMPEGAVCALPAFTDTASLRSAVGMCADMDALTEIDITGLGKGASDLALSDFAAGASLTKAGSTLKLTDVATGARASLAAAFKGSTGLSRVELTRVGGERLDATEAFAGCSAIERADVSSLGGAFTDLTRAFAGTSRGFASETEVTWSFIDTVVFGGCVIDRAFEDAFTTESIAATSSVTFAARSTNGPVASAVAVFAPTSPERKCMMPKIDLSGFGGASVQAGSTGSVAYFFAGNGAAKSAGADAASDIVLPRTADWTNATSAAYLFAECTALERAEVTDLCANAGGIDMTGVFSGCASLTSATLASSVPVATSSAEAADQAQAKIGTASSLVAAFKGCAALKAVDLSGVGTYGLPGTIDAYGTANDDKTGMSAMFDGCASLLYDASDPLMAAMEAAKSADDPDALDEARDAYERERGELGRVTIGPAFTKVMNGFFAWRDIADRRPLYLLAADVYVFGGPYGIGGASTSEATNLMGRPDVGGYAYFGEVMLADGAAQARNDAVTLGGVKGLWTIQGYFDTPMPAVTLTFTADWDEGAATPASQSKAFKSAKYKLDATMAAKLQKAGEAISTAGVTAPTAKGYAAAAADGSVAESATDVAWYMTGSGEFTYLDREGAEHAFTWEAGQRAVSQEEYEAATTEEQASLCPILGATFFGPMPLTEPDENGEMQPVKVGNTQVYGEAPSFTLTCKAAEVAYEVILTDAAQGKSASLGRLAYSGSITLPKVSEVAGEDWTRPGYEFLGWTLGAAAPEDWTSTSYLMPGSIAGAHEESVTKTAAYPSGAMSGYASVPAVLYAQWAEVPKVTFHVNNSTTWAAIVGTDVEGDEDVVTIGEGYDWAYQVRGATESGYGLIDGEVVYDAEAGVNRYVAAQEHGAVTGRAVRDAAGRLSTFEVAVPDVYATPTQSDLAWNIDVNCTSAPVGLFKQSRTWTTKTSLDLYRRVGAAVLTIDFEPGPDLASSENAYSRSFEEGKPYVLPGVSFVRNGYAFDRWTGIWQRSSDPSAEAGTYTIDGVEVSFLQGQPIRMPDGTNGLRDGAELSAAVASALFPVPTPENAGAHAKLTATWSARTYTVTLLLNDRAGSTDSFTYTTAQTPMNVSDPARAGYAFAGWTGGAVKADDGSWQLPRGTFGNLTLSALWTPTRHTLTYDLKGAYSDLPSNPRWGASQGAGGFDTGERLQIPDPVWDGFTFTGWTIPGMASPVRPFVFSEEVETWESQITLTAHWEPVDFAITYELAGGKWAEGVTPHATYRITHGDYALPTPVREGYVFLGWTGSNGTLAQKDVVIAAGSVGAKSYRASWQAEGYTISWNLDGGRATSWKKNGVPQTGALPTTYTAEDEIEVAIPEKASAEFLGWSGSLSAIGQDVDMVTGTLRIERNTTGNLAFKANWRFTSYAVAFAPGAYLNSDDQLEQGSFSREHADTEAHWLALSEGVSGISSPEVSAIEMPAASWGAYLRHRELLGWGVTEDAVRSGGKVWAPGDAPTLMEILGTEGADVSAAGVITLYAQWGTAERAIAYRPLGGDVGTDAPQSYFAGEGLAADELAKAKPTRPGYSFAGWYADPAYAGDAVTSIPADERGEVELFAKWTYEVRYDAAGAAGATLPAEQALTWYACGDYLSAAHLGSSFDPSMQERIEAAAATQVAAAAGPDGADATSAWSARGYVFSGSWSTASVTPGEAGEEASRVAAGAPVNGRLQPSATTGIAVLYAIWDPISYGIQLAGPAGFEDGFDQFVEGLAESDPAWTGGRLEVTYGKGWKTPVATPAWEGHGFTGWALAERGEGGAIHIVTGEGARTFGAGVEVAEDLVDASGAADALIVATFEATDHQTMSLAANGGAQRTDVAASDLFPVNYAVSAGESAETVTVTLPGADAYPEGVTAPDLLAPFAREGYLLSGWKWTDSTGEHEAKLSWGEGDEADSRVGTGDWVVTLAAGTGDIAVTAQWAPVPYRVAYYSDATTRAQVQAGWAYGEAASPLFGQGSLENAGMSLASWAVSADGAGTAFAPGATVTLEELVAAAKAAGAGASDPAQAGAHLGYVVVADGADGAVTERGDESAETVREVRLYAQWSARLSGTVPTRMVLVFDGAANNGAGGFSAGTAQIESTTRRPLKVAALKAKWDLGAYEGLQSIWRDNSWTDLSASTLVVTDEGARVEAAMDAREMDAQSVTTTDLTGAQGPITSPANADENVKLGFRIPAAAGDEAGVLKLGYAIRMATAYLNEATPPPSDGEGTHICDLVYTIAVAE